MGCDMTDTTNISTYWKTIADEIQTRALESDARMKELMQRANHWQGLSLMLSKELETLKDEADGWKLRALKSEQQRQSLRDLLVIAEGQRDQAKIDAKHWKAEWAVAMGQLGGARAEVEAMRQDYGEGEV